VLTNSFTFLDQTRLQTCHHERDVIVILFYIKKRGWRCEVNTHNTCICGEKSMNSESSSSI